MGDKARAYRQYLIPQHFLSECFGLLANTKITWFKTWAINRFIRKYHIDLKDALTPDPNAYATFNEFFIRKLTPQSRPIAEDANAIISPADGTIAQIGHANKNQLLQAKQFYFSLETLFGNDKKTASYFEDGAFTTIYLAPHNYHRVHMPINGRLERTIYVPGKLFSVNRATTDHIPNLYARNERFIAVFNTDVGKMAVVFVGAMIVGSIQPSWMNQPVRGKQIASIHFTNPIPFQKGDELGYFNLGSTVILLFEKNKTEWQPTLQPNSPINFGEKIGLLK